MFFESTCCACGLHCDRECGFMVLEAKLTAREGKKVIDSIEFLVVDASIINEDNFTVFESEVSSNKEVEAFKTKYAAYDLELEVEEL